ncbi:MAG: cytochrome [Gammaproteobacteria bacterium]|jgi:cytochrome P450|nr:cytochrome [Gammaproteobacteria bacterium]
MSPEIPGAALLDRQILADPYPFYHRLQREAPVWHVPSTEVYTVTSFALLEEAARRVEDFSSNMRCLLYRDDHGLPARLAIGDAASQALATADPPLHAVHRRTVFSEFIAKRMTALEPEIAEIATGCVERALDQRNVDFMALVGNVVPITVIGSLIGFQNSDPMTLLRAAFDSTALVGGTLSQPQLFEHIGRSAEIQTWIGAQLAEAKGTGDDILTTIQRGVDSGALRTQEGTGILHILLAAGGESTTSLIGNSVRILAENAALQQQLREQPDHIKPFLEEVLRLESPFRSMLRSVPKDTKLGGVDIPEGSTVLMFWSAGNRDPAAFENPDEMVLGRPLRHMTFGRGIHTCVGAPLARLEGRVVLSKLIERTASFTLDPDQPPPEWVESLQVRRYQHLPLKLVPH